MKKKNDWKSREGVVYSTDPSFGYSLKEQLEAATPPSQQQHLIVSLDKSGRAGKQVTLVTGYTGKTGDLEALTKLLKTKCGVGGSCKEREILMQGDVRDKVVQLLLQQGYKAKKSG